MNKRSPFRYFKTSPANIRLAVMLYIRFPLSLRNVEDLLHERGIEISHEAVRFWWNRFGPMFAADMLEANDLTVGIVALVAEHELRVISKRTKESLAVAKAHD